MSRWSCRCWAAFSAHEAGRGVPRLARGDGEAALAGEEGCSPGRGACSSSAARDFETRLTAVQRALYLLFNEGYHGAVSRRGGAPRPLP
jgi:hypothetical protein